MRNHCMPAVVAILVFSGVVLAGEEAPKAAETWLNYSADETPSLLGLDESDGVLLAQAQAAERSTSGTQLPTQDTIPLPAHTIEGVGGGTIVPTAYLVNPGPEGTVIGLPSVSFSYVNLTHKKSIQSFAVTQTFFRRIEVGYGLARLDMGTLPEAVTKIRGTRLRRTDIYLNTFNVRAMLVEEDSFGLPLPAITAGVHFKVNCNIRTLEHRLGAGGLKSIGYDRDYGIDYTLSASKLFTQLPAPVVVTVGLRNSRAAHIGFAGFANSCETTIETSVACFLSEWLVVSYEFRQKLNRYHDPAMPGLLGEEDDWHALSFALILNEHLTVSGGWGCLGNIGNTDASGAWGLQIKYDF